MYTCVYQKVNILKKLHKNISAVSVILTGYTFE